MAKYDKGSPFWFDLDKLEGLALRRAVSRMTSEAKVRITRLKYHNAAPYSTAYSNLMKSNITLSIKGINDEWDLRVYAGQVREFLINDSKIKNINEKVKEHASKVYSDKGVRLSDVPGMTAKKLRNLLMPLYIARDRAQEILYQAGITPDSDYDVMHELVEIMEKEKLTVEQATDRYIKIKVDADAAWKEKYLLKDESQWATKKRLIVD